LLELVELTGIEPVTS